MSQIISSFHPCFMLTSDITMQMFKIRIFEQTLKENWTDPKNQLNKKFTRSAYYTFVGLQLGSELPSMLFYCSRLSSTTKRDQKPVLDLITSLLYFSSWPFTYINLGVSSLMRQETGRTHMDSWSSYGYGFMVGSSTQIMFELILIQRDIFKYYTSCLMDKGSKCFGTAFCCQIDSIKNSNMCSQAQCIY